VQVDEFCGGVLSHFADFIRRNGRTKFSEGNSRYSCEPLDLTEVQGRYGIFSRGLKFRRGRAVDSHIEPQGPLDLHVIS
jgi:hypothetical protein